MSYTPGHTGKAVNFMARRRLQTHGGFLIPHLRSGMRVLDCGCGPGTMTLDIAALEHLAGPERAISEFKRVLRSGGFAALRSPDWGGFILYPYPEEVARAVDRYRELMRSNGGDPLAGRKLGPLLRDAGFDNTVTSANYEIYEEPTLIGEYLAAQLDQYDSCAAEVLRAWYRDPDAFFAQAWVEAIGWKS